VRQNLCEASPREADAARSAILPRMEMIAVVLVLISAVMHASWNLLAKRSADPLAFLFWLNLTGLVIFAIPAGWMLARHGLPLAGLPFLLGSTVFETLYLIFLAAAYRTGALSLTYPVARGTGVLLVPLLAVPLLGERPTGMAFFGIGLILSGIVAIGFLGARAKVAEELEHGRRGLLFALLTGCSIAGYSLMDKAGVAHIHPLVYLYGFFVLETIILTPYMLARKRAAISDEWRRARREIMLGGLLNPTTYLIVLAALRISNVSYIVPLRETGIVFATLLGVFVLRERIGRVRLAGCGLVALGVIAIVGGG
jgi:uncharacterized membrane protein